MTAFGFVHNRGAVIETDERMREDTIDRDGNSWLDLDENGQRRQFGRQMFVHGDHGRAIRVADERAQETAAATKAAAAEHNGLAALRDAYREGAAARRSRTRHAKSHDSRPRDLEPRRGGVGTSLPQHGLRRADPRL